MIEHLFLITRTLSSPLEAFFTLLIFILSKELDISPLQLTILASAKPAVSLIAYFVCKQALLKAEKKYLIFLNLAGCLPVLCFPFIENAWFFIGSYAVFQITQRAAFPAWVELLKIEGRSLPPLFSKSTSIHYLITVFVPLLLTTWIDFGDGTWKYIFFSLALIQILSTSLILRLPSKSLILNDPSSTKGLEVLKNNRPFRQYLILFFLGGSGLVLIQPVLPTFFNETLHLSYQELALAFSFSKGIAFILSSPFWAKISKRMSLYRLNVYINLFSLLFIVFLLASILKTSLLFPAYIFYGTMQAGCEMSFSLSGPVFSKEKQSTLYSGLNLLFIGIRGCICPLLGEILFIAAGAPAVFIIAGGLCLIGILYIQRIPNVGFYQRLHQGL